MFDANRPKRQRKDGQISSLAGEFFAAAELLKRGLQTSVTLGNAKAVDLLAYNSRTKTSFPVQVKTLREKNFFLIDHKKIERDHIYLFVLLNKPGEHVQFFVVPGIDLLDSPEKFSKYFVIEKMPGIHPSILAKLGYEDAWSCFGPLAV